jgi:hypothetical protein
MGRLPVEGVMYSVYCRTQDEAEAVLKRAESLSRRRV